MNLFNLRCLTKFTMYLLLYHLIFLKYQFRLNTLKINKNILKIKEIIKNVRNFISNNYKNSKLN